jgi:hypothetical protein
LTHSRCHSNEFDDRPFTGAECDVSHYLVVTEFTAILAVSKQATQEFDMERFNLKKLYMVEGKE